MPEGTDPSIGGNAGAPSQPVQRRLQLCRGQVSVGIREGGCGMLAAPLWSSKCWDNGMEVVCMKMPGGHRVDETCLGSRLELGVTVGVGVEGTDRWLRCIGVWRPWRGRLARRPPMPTPRRRPRPPQPAADSPSRPPTANCASASPLAVPHQLWQCWAAAQPCLC